MKTPNTRTLASQILNDVITARQPFRPDTLKALQSLSPQDKAFTQFLCFGVLRYYPRLLFYAAKALHKPLSRKDQDVHLVILCGLFQIFHSEVAPFAIIHQSVNSALELGKSHLAPVVNACLRQAHTHKAQWESGLSQSLGAFWAHPKWWIKTIKQAWPEDWESILTANNAQAPMCVRVNLSHQSEEDYLAQCQALKIHAKPLPSVPGAIIIDPPCAVEKLPGFEQGDLFVQDGAAQLGPPLLMPKAGEHILDACAAPGGKSTHLWALEPKLKRLTVIDKTSNRQSRLSQNLKRMGVLAQQIHEDAINVTSWWDNTPFDKILLDPSCSGSGVIRRHPDIKLLRRSEDLDALVAEQAQLLDRLWTTLKDQGHFLYMTCSIFPQENDQQIATFLKRTPDARLVAFQLPVGRPTQYGWQILPGEAQLDGFYYSLLEKVPESSVKA